MRERGFEKASHHPIAALNGDTTKQFLHLSVKSGGTIQLSAAGSKDPDGDELTTNWFVYSEAGTFRGPVELSATKGDVTRLIAPVLQTPETIHVIAQVEDSGTPVLTAYRRAIVTVHP